MKARQNLYLEPKLNSQLEALAEKPGGSKSAILNDALRAYLRKRGAATPDEDLTVRLDRLFNHLARIERNQQVAIESLALFIRYELGNTPPLPAREQAAAQALGKDRFEAFIVQISRRIADGKSVSLDVIARASANPDQITRMAAE
jgi:hypothetical protein